MSYLGILEFHQAEDHVTKSAPWLKKITEVFRARLLFSPHSRIMSTYLFQEHVLTLSPSPSLRQESTLSHGDESMDESPV